MTYFTAPAAKMPTKPETIIELVCKDWEISKDDLLSNKHHPEFAIPRHVAIWLMKVYTDTRGKELEDIFNRGHSSVSRSCSKVQSFMSIYPEFKNRVNNILKHL